MVGEIGHLLPDAKELRRHAAIREAMKADEFVRLLTEAELEKTALVESLGKPDNVSEGETIKLASAVIQRAARGGLFEVEVYRFSNLLCTDGGLAIGMNATGWENTLAGAPREIYRLWSKYLLPRGYRIRYFMNGLPGSLPNNVSIVVSWGD
jgi:hypothetical protein